MSVVCRHGRCEGATRMILVFHGAPGHATRHQRLMSQRGAASAGKKCRSKGCASASRTLTAYARNGAAWTRETKLTVARKTPLTINGGCDPA